MRDQAGHLLGAAMLSIALLGCGGDPAEAVDAAGHDAAEHDAELGPDARPDAMPELVVADISGDALLALRVGLPAQPVVRLRATWTLVARPDDEAALQMSATALDVSTGVSVGDPFVGGPVVVAADGSFAMPLVGLLPGSANPISAGETSVDAVLHGRIVDADLSCGTVTGSAGSFLLTDTTFGGARISNDTLPAAVVACPAP